METCGKEKLYGGMEAKLEGGIIAMRLLWAHHAQEVDYGLLLIDVCNVFNEDNWKAILWSVQFDSPSGTQFTFHCYRHWATMVVRNMYGSGHFLNRKEGVTKGDTLSIITYGIGILPLIRDLRTAHLHIMQRWYAGDACVGGTFDALQEHIRDFLVRVIPWGYFPEPTKSILVVSLRNVRRE